MKAVMFLSAITTWELAKNALLGAILIIEEMEYVMMYATLLIVILIWEIV
eukprot:CAMPEP_0202951974 /NCGR_PEP_ID=MMETSP1395-20130829/35013_1 /ASSEMBLY_ACC=CAM_ASM_000871 /TAXON_ID=5961 /ORGANISM="Blepharisma japonicum, Strain Stock R1072" /LENGTH=49 /DNA_ID=CAMNT_0049660671 /DNA_START=335 /DNA_END=484 /DNA_ORIENTATION=-